MLRLCRLAVCVLLASPVACIAAGLPDTGQDTCFTDSAADPRPPSSLESVARDGGAYPRQDCRYGRDAAANAGVAKVGAGAKGFDYTKVTGFGSSTSDPTVPLGPNPADWQCTLDQSTGLMWEVKTGGAGDLRYSNHTYTWSNPDFTTNGGNPGDAGTNTCAGTLAQCNTQAYVNAVNAAFLCTYTDWRLPTRRELLTLVHIQTPAPTVDPTYFVNTGSSFYWTATTVPFNPPNAAFVDFTNGSTNVSAKTSTLVVRLVRGPAY